MSVYPLPPRSFLLNEIEIIQIIKLLIGNFYQNFKSNFQCERFQFYFYRNYTSYYYLCSDKRLVFQHSYRDHVKLNRIIEIRFKKQSSNIACQIRKTKFYFSVTEVQKIDFLNCTTEYPYMSSKLIWSSRYMTDEKYNVNLVQIEIRDLI